MRRKLIKEASNEKTKVFLSKWLSIETKEDLIRFDIERKGLGNECLTLKPNEFNEKNISKLKDYGCYLNDWQIRNLIYHIYPSELENLEYYYYHEGIGWCDIDNSKAFRHNELLGVNISSVYTGTDYNLSAKGTLENWKKGIQNHVIGSKYLEVVLATAFTSPLISLIGDDNITKSIILNISGSSSIEKNTVISLALSPWGYPGKGNRGLMKTWNGSDKGIFSCLRGNKGITIAIDDTSLTSKKDFTQMIYRLALGEAHSAHNRNGKAREKENWETTIILSSKIPILEALDIDRTEAKARIFEINCAEGMLTLSQEHAKSIEKFVFNNYGHAGEIFVRYLIKNGLDKINNRYEEIKASLSKRTTKIGISQRAISKLTLIYLAAELINKSLNLNLNLNQIEQTILEIEKKQYEKSSIYIQAYNSFIEYFLDNQNQFIIKELREKIDANHLGIYEVDRDGKPLKIMIPCNKFKILIEKLGHEKLSVIQGWEKEGLLKHDKGRYDKNINFGMRRCKGYEIIIKGKLK